METENEADQSSDSESEVEIIDEEAVVPAEPPGVFFADQYNLSFNLNLRLVICKTCEMGLSYKQLYYHLAIFHKFPNVKKSSIDSNVDDALTGPYEDSPYLLPTLQLLPRVQGIRTFTGYRCRECPYYCRLWKQMREHYEKLHDEDDLLKQNSICHIQKLFKNNCCYYGVQDDEMEEDANGEVIELAHNRLNEYLEPTCRLINPNSKYNAMTLLQTILIFLTILTMNSG